MSWYGVITDTGAELLEQLLKNGGRLGELYALYGIGYTDPVNMRSRQQLVQDIGEANIVKKKITESGVEFSISITPDHMERLVKEVGIYAAYNGRMVMVALYQDEEGLRVPRKRDFPDYAFNLRSVWKIDNTGELTVASNPDALVTNYALQQELLEYIKVNQGAANAGKILVVGADGYLKLAGITPATEVSF